MFLFHKYLGEKYHQSLVAAKYAPVSLGLFSLHQLVYQLSAAMHIKFVIDSAVVRDYSIDGHVHMTSNIGI